MIVLNNNLQININNTFVYSSETICRLCYRVFKTTIGFKANPLRFSTVREDTEPSAGFSN